MEQFLLLLQIWSTVIFEVHVSDVEFYHDIEHATGSKQNVKSENT